MSGQGASSFASETLLTELCNALGWQGGTFHDAIRHVRALREHNQNQSEVIDQFLGIDDWHDDFTAPAALIKRAQILQGAQPQGPYPSRRLAVLTHELPAIHGLLMESLHLTHADVLRMGSTDAAVIKGLTVYSVNFEHVPTGNPYLVTVVSIPKAPAPEPDLG